MGEAQSRELMENRLRLVMIDRMLKEKYNEISYLAIQPPKDPQIVEINQKDLDWLLDEQKKCEDALLKVQEYENRYMQIVQSSAWRRSIRFVEAARAFLRPVRRILHRNKKRGNF